MYHKVYANNGYHYVSGRNIKLVAITRYLQAVNKNKNDGYHFSFFAHTTTTTHSFAALWYMRIYVCVKKDLFKV